MFYQPNCSNETSAGFELDWCLCSDYCTMKLWKSVVALVAPLLASLNQDILSPGWNDDLRPGFVLNRWMSVARHHHLKPNCSGCCRFLKVPLVLAFRLIYIFFHLAVIPEKCDSSPADSSRHLQIPTHGITSWYAEACTPKRPANKNNGSLIGMFVRFCSSFNAAHSGGRESTSSSDSESSSRSDSDGESAAEVPRRRPGSSSVKAEVHSVDVWSQQFWFGF